MSIWRRAGPSKAPETTVTDDLITPDNVSNELLLSLFDAAFMETRVDDDGDIQVLDQCGCWVVPSKEKKRIRLFTFFRFSPSATELQQLTCANEINKSYVIVKTAVGKGGRLTFEHDLSLEGGVTRKAVVLLVKRFCSIPHPAIEDLGKEIIE